MADKEVYLTQLINTLQKLTVYETYHSFYIIGSNLAGTYYRVLKIDRTCDIDKLEFSEDLHEYDREEIDELLIMIKNANNGISTIKSYKAFGLVGFIRFLEGYYMILITKQIPVAILGYHIIYTIADAIIIYIPYEDKTQQKEPNLDEQRYLKLFQTIDLRQNFYFSYTYDLTHTLQYNLTEFKFNNLENILLTDDSLNIGYLTKPDYKYVWNDFLLRPVRDRINYQWQINLIHGFLSQSCLNIYGCSIYITLISRRSQKYAGTRFLKRGGTREGYVANEVETEQIVNNSSISSFKKGFFTSFVHMRGSIPLFWSQDPNKVPKPPINIDIYDPFSTVAAAHFEQLLRRFGAPVVILNLVKMREKKAQESMLGYEYKYCLEYLEQFLPNNNYFQYIYFDMAKLNKTDKGNVMNRLYDIAESCVTQTGIFQNFKPLYSNEYASSVLKSQHHAQNMFDNDGKPFTKQRGIVRVNCVDCLDRTNTAMYVIGKCAFAYQLYALGVLQQPFIETDSVCEKMLIELYEKSGDSIAQQYAGSQLVHRVDTYNKNTFASQSRDMIHTLSRYYSNAFSDTDKQHAMNVFLGIYKPYAHNTHIWDLQTDCYLHDPYLVEPWKQPKRYNDWIDEVTFNCLPLASDEETKSIENCVNKLEAINNLNEFRVDIFDSYYKPHKLTVFDETYYFNILQINRLNETTPNSLTSGLKAIILDPFMQRNKTKTNQQVNQNVNFNSVNQPSPVATLTSQTNSVKEQQQASSDSESDDSYTLVQQSDVLTSPKRQVNTVMPQQATVTTERQKLYKDVNVTINENSLNIYRKYLNENNSVRDNNIDFYNKLFSFNSKTDSYEIFEPKVNSESEEIYRSSIYVGVNGAQEPNDKNKSIYEEFVRNFTLNKV